MKLPANLLRVLRLFGPYRRRLALGFVGMILTALTEPMLPAVFKTLLDKGFASHPAFPLWAVPVVIIGIFVLRGFSTFLTGYMMSWASTHVLNDLQQMNFNRILDVPASKNEHNTKRKENKTAMFE